MSRHGWVILLSQTGENSSPDKEIFQKIVWGSYEDAQGKVKSLEERMNRAGGGWTIAIVSPYYEYDSVDFQAIECKFKEYFSREIIVEKFKSLDILALTEVSHEERLWEIEVFTEEAEEICKKLGQDDSVESAKIK